MNFNRKFYIISISLIALASCNVFNSSKLNNGTMNMKNQSLIMEPVVMQGYVPVLSDNYSIENAILEDTILTIDLSYLGGCKQHSFNLVFNGMYKKSLPRQADLYLLHENQGDTCTENRNLTLSYNLASIIGSGNQAVNFTLVGYPDKLKYGSVSKN